MQDIIRTIPNAFGKGLHETLRRVYGTDFLGITWNQGQVIVHLEDSANPANATAILDAHQTLTLVTNKVTIQANGTDTATITLPTTKATIGYEVYASDLLVDFSGTLTAVAGSVSYAFNTALAGVYTVRFYETIADGYMEVTAL